MGAILLAVTGLDPKPWEERFRALAPRRDIRVWPERVGEPGEVAYACAWHAPHGLLAHFLHLKIIFSLGAGVDHIVADPHLPNVPVLCCFLVTGTSSASRLTAAHEAASAPLFCKQAVAD